MQQRGFTLVELSIVLVIIGLLVGGVLTGQSLIRAAELRSVSSQLQRYQAAVMTFRDKYFALPGDMTNATAYWGAADGSTGNTAACATTASTTATTCNGNGDGQITTSTASAEGFRFWQHLANAGLIEGNYNGIAGAGNTTANSPSGRMSSSLFNMVYVPVEIANYSYFDNNNYGNTYQFGGLLASNAPSNPILKPEDAYNIDTKLDDGKPATGKVMIREVNGFAGTNCTTATASSMLTATYNLSSTAVTCVLLFPQAF